jgi:hypothetical protein
MQDKKSASGKMSFCIVNSVLMTRKKKATEKAENEVCRDSFSSHFYQ